MPTPQHPIASRNPSTTAPTTGPDHKAKCGCVTFWFASSPSSKGTALFREACGIHRRYAERLGILLHAKPGKTRHAA